MSQLINFVILDVVRDMELLLLNVLLVCPHLLKTKCLGYFPCRFEIPIKNGSNCQPVCGECIWGMGFLAVTWFTGSPARLR